MNNYQFCAQWIEQRFPKQGVRILDYGCGAGQIVEELKKRGFDTYGCDVFFGGGDASQFVDRSLWGTCIFRMDEDKIPFPDHSFDYVINNQVMEHVPDLDNALKEIDRVLKPGGGVLSLFADDTVWTEGHCGIPFLHWFPKGSRFRIYYAAALRSLGLGSFTAGKTIMQWSRDFCEWLDKWCYYRPLPEIHQVYKKYFTDLEHIEVYWLSQRLENRAWLVSWLPNWLQQSIVRKRGGIMFAVKKPAT